MHVVHFIEVGETSLIKNVLQKVCFNFLGTTENISFRAQTTTLIESSGFGHFFSLTKITNFSYHQYF